MTKDALEFHFAAPELRLSTGLKQHYLPIPMEIADELRANKVRRVMAYHVNRFSRSLELVHKIKTKSLWDDLRDE